MGSNPSFPRTVAYAGPDVLSRSYDRRAHSDVDLGYHRQKDIGFSSRCTVYSSLYGAPRF